MDNPAMLFCAEGLQILSATGAWAPDDKKDIQ